MAVVSYFKSLERVWESVSYFTSAASPLASSQFQGLIFLKCSFGSFKAIWFKSHLVPGLFVMRFISNDLRTGYADL